MTTTDTTQEREFQQTRYNLRNVESYLRIVSPKKQVLQIVTQINTIKPLRENIINVG